MKSTHATKSDLDIAYDSALKSLKEYKDFISSIGTDEIVKIGKIYFEWIDLKTKIVQEEKYFVIPDDKRKFIKRTYVHWINFGFNLGNEFGGRHPAIILKVTGNSVFVLPLSSGKIPDDKKDKPYCISIPFIHDFPRMSRWANLYRIICISNLRIDYNANHGRVSGKVMNGINKAIKESGINL